MVSLTHPAISINALTDPVAIVHIPIDLADLCSSKLYWTVENAPELSAEFFNVTSNVVEIAVFACTDLADAYWTDLPDSMDGVKISSTWRVFEVASGDQGETNNYDSPHLRQVSAPLSRAGISILYQSSYFTDFLLVKESDFDKASHLFADQGWHVDPTVPTSRRRSQVVTPTTAASRSSVSPVSLPATPELTVLPSPLACVGFSHSIECATAERLRQLVVWPRQARNSWRQKRQSFDSSASPSRNASPNSPVDDGRPPFLSYTRTEDGASIVTETRILRWMFGRRRARSVSRDGYESAIEGTEFQLGGQLSAGYVTDTTDLDASSDDEAGMTSQARWSGSPVRRGRDSQVTLGLHTPPINPSQGPTQLSLPVAPRDSPGLLPISWTRDLTRSGTITLRDRAPRNRDHKVGRKRCLQLDLRGIGDDDHPDQSTSGEQAANYHMDKSGLVTLFSDMLDGGSIRMLYSSTFNTANILVEAGDVHRARRLLQGRGRSPVKDRF